MPRAKQQSKKPQFELKGFVPCNLSADDKRNYQGWATQQTDFGRFMDSWLSDGYKVSFSSDSYHNCSLCSVTCVDPDNPHYGFTLAGRGPAWSDALGVAAYKHFIMLEGDWTEGIARPKDYDQWG